MGSGELKKAFEAYSKVGTPHPIVFVFDRDESSIVREFEEQAVDYKFQNGVIGMCLKVPDHRLDTPNICIEHLYTDDALQTCVAGTQKRLRFTHEIGFESDKKTAYLRPTPGERSLKIFDQDVAAIGQENGEQKGELAISKNAFFDEIVCSQSGDGFDLSGFKPTLERLLDAISKIKK